MTKSCGSQTVKRELTHGKVFALGIKISDDGLHEDHVRITVERQDR
jgi:hypothetical protein